MSGIFGGSKSSSSSTPVDFTPEAFSALQGPLAQTLLSLFQGNIPAYSGQPGANLFATQPTVPNPAVARPQTPAAPAQAPAATGGIPAFKLAGFDKLRDAMSQSNRLGLTREQLTQMIGGTPAPGAPGAAGGPGAPGAVPGQPGMIPNPNAAPAATEDQLVAQMTPEQRAILDQIIGSTLAGSPNYAASQQMLGQTIQGDFLRPESNPFLAATIEMAQRPLQEQFEQSIVPQLLSRFAAAGQQVQGAGSTAFANQANLAASQQGRALGDVSTAIAGNNYQQERQRQIDATAQASAISTEEMNRAVTGLQQAALPQMIKDLGIQRGLEQFNKRMDTLLAALQLASGVTQPTIANQQQSKSKENANIGPLLSAGLFGV